MHVLSTERLNLRWFHEGDAAFILELLNDPGWIQFIGNKNVKTLDDACKYIVNGPMAMYERVGFGLYLVERKGDGVPIGMCGLIKREGLDDVDIGFAFLPAYCAQGFAQEAAMATLAFGRATFGMKRIVAITNAENHRSIRLLEKIGLEFEKMVKMRDDEPPLMLLACNA